MRTDLHHQQGTFIGVFLADLKQCYEHVGHQTLRDEFKVCSFPLHVLRFTLSSYCWPRRLMMDSALSEPVEPSRGIAAGSSTAAYDIKSYMLPNTQGLKLGADEDLTIHIDDITTSVAMPTIQSSVNGLASLWGLVFDLITNGLELPIAQANAVHHQHQRGCQAGSNIFLGGKL